MCRVTTLTTKSASDDQRERDHASIDQGSFAIERVMRVTLNRMGNPVHIHPREIAFLESHHPYTSVQTVSGEPEERTRAVLVDCASFCMQLVTHCMGKFAPANSNDRGTVLGGRNAWKAWSYWWTREESTYVSMVYSLLESSLFYSMNII